MQSRGIFRSSRRIQAVLKKMEQDDPDAFAKATRLLIGLVKDGFGTRVYEEKVQAFRNFVRRWAREHNGLPGHDE